MNESYPLLFQSHFFALIFFPDAPNCDKCSDAIKQLEDIDDDTDAVGVKFVKTDDADFAEAVGVTEFPTIVYFERKQPSVYDGTA